MSEQEDLREVKLNFILSMVRSLGTLNSEGSICVVLTTSDFLGANDPEYTTGRIVRDVNAGEPLNVQVSDLMVSELQYNMEGIHVIAYDSLSKKYVDIPLTVLDEENLNFLIRILV